MTDAFEKLFNEQQWQFDNVSYRRWRDALGACNDYELEHSKRCLRYAIQHELTETQMQYLAAYYFDDMNTIEIAELYGVDKSSVSRGILRAEERLFKVLRYSNPRFFSLPAPIHKRTRRKGNNHARKESIV